LDLDLARHSNKSQDARATASAIELEFTVGHCASVKEVAQTMIWKPDQY